jgi:pyruvate,water dikinase
MIQKNILWFKDIDHDDIAKVGGKGANLGEMYKIGIPVPNGFVVTTDAYFQFIKDNNLTKKIKQILDTTDVNIPNQLQSASERIKKIIVNADLNEQTAIDIMKAYKKLSGYFSLKDVPVAVRSSATAEDLPDASFAGQQETFLNVFGETNVLKRVQDCWASLFTPRAIFYRQQKKFDHFQAGVAVPIQRQIQSTVSGIMFTVNPVTNNKSQIIVETAWGLGEYVVQGTVSPDQYIIDKNSWKITDKNIVEQKIQLVKAVTETKEIKVPRSKQNKASISPQMAIKIAKLGQKLHNHYTKPQDIEFAIEKNKLYIVQTRPITTVVSNQKTLDSQLTINKAPDLIGEAASPGTASGKVIIINNPKKINLAKTGHILVTQMTSPDFVPAMKKVSGIITDKGGQTSHAAIVSRELGVPCVVGTKTATTFLKNGDIVTLNGTTGQVWLGNLAPNITTADPKSSAPRKKVATATKIYVNLGEPQLAKDISKRQIDGVGLLRAEFMMANIGVHPKRAISQGREKQYIDKLSKGLYQFCHHFSPRPVIYRTSDFKTNEYRHLKWGTLYEPVEPNPMLGFRGAGRYINSPDVFNMELEAIKIIRNKHRLKNLWVMIPFVRTVEQLKQVKKLLNDAGLVRSPTFKLFMMVEIPSNVILLDKFIDVGIDGISIGSNDLTMLTLGLDRDNSEVAPDFNEMDPAVLWMLEKAITTAKKRGILASICGQAPSNYPELVEKLVKWGVSSISVSPDVIDHTRDIVSWAENQRLKKDSK